MARAIGELGRVVLLLDGFERRALISVLQRALPSSGRDTLLLHAMLSALQEAERDERERLTDPEASHE